MIPFSVGIFDDFVQASNAYHALLSRRINEEVSFIVREINDEEAISFLSNNEDVSEDIAPPFSGGATAAFSVVAPHLIHFDFNGVGQLIMSGPLADQLLTTKSFSPNMNGSLSQAFWDLGFDPETSDNFQELIIAGRTLILVRADHFQETTNTFKEFGTLDIIKTETNPKSGL
ncbi:hypothetical protein M1116_01020 [Patescibacteria group bacterium]|nr:hypothetical protein [Patescibacteria group bacterium]